MRIRPLRDDLAFGARIVRITHQVLADEAARQRIRDQFEKRGLIDFSNA